MSQATIAVDFLGGDSAPDCVADAIAAFLRTSEAARTRLIVVGPTDLSRSMLADRGVAASEVDYVAADRAVRMGAEALTEVRGDEHVTANVAAGLVAAGRADAWVSAGHSGAAIAASALAMGRVPGMAVPALAVVLPALAGPVVLADAGATMDVTPENLLAFAMAGCAYAASLGIDSPTVGLLSIGGEPGKGDRLRKSAHDLLTIALNDAGIDYVGPVEGFDAALGGRARVIVADGFTGNVLLKGIEGAVRWSAVRMGDAYADPEPAAAVLTAVATSDFAGGLLLGVDGVTVIGHGAGTAPEVAACIRLAARAVRGQVVERTQRTFAEMSGLAVGESS